MQVTLSDIREMLGVEQHPKCEPKRVALELGWRIVVLQRGWVVVGQVTQYCDEITIENASVIRAWGTTKGLGQLAIEGVQPATKLDPCGTVRAHLAAVVLQMESDVTKWKK